jgi:hypothetical protein
MPGRLDWSPKKNWVEEEGGLPDFIERVAIHLIGKGMPRARAIATAISTCKKWCATGEVHQWQGTQIINAGSRAQACAAVAQWEKMKASARAKRG